MGIDSEHVNEVSVPGYQTIAVEYVTATKTTFLYIGTNFVAMNPGEWERFKRIVNYYPDRGAEL